MENNQKFITFIIPTIGRESLKDTITSLKEQNVDDWNAIIIFDGIKKNIEINDNRIEFIEIEKNGIESLKNCAGHVRNIGIEYCKNSEWIAFLDDDDTISVDYISKLKDEINMNNSLEICIFRMGYQNKYVLPSKNDKGIFRSKVGISFAVKKHIFNTIKFTNNPFEDYIFLKNAENKKYKIIISSYVTYFVRTKAYPTDIFPKILINF